jgi:alpha-glucosidase (family GH31 glycosyl hydrolase)
MHNAYPTLFHRVTREAVEEWERAHPDRGPVWFFTRAGYAGRSGSARYEGSNFAGDGNTDFSRSSGLASQTPDMLNRAIGGAYGFTTDIGGYFDFVTPRTTKELFIRWAQWATLSPVMRVHGSINAGTHMPWTYDEETVQEYRRLGDLRLRARPLIARLWREATRTGIPVTRPLWLGAPEAPDAATEDQQWLLGEDVLVAPVVRAGARERQVSFPRGCWRHGETGARYRGPARRAVAAPLLSLPWFVRCGRRLR